MNRDHLKYFDWLLGVCILAYIQDNKRALLELRERREEMETW
ncbi:hypothetical protein IC582_015557 [Cucumis melo]